jgi:anaerobic C4-dicarboxylate transporter
MQPPGVQYLLAVGCAWCTAVPGASMCVLGVLPLGLNPILEQVVCSGGLQLAGGLDVVVQTVEQQVTRRKHKLLEDGTCDHAACRAQQQQ